VWGTTGNPGDGDPGWGAHTTGVGDDANAAAPREHATIAVNTVFR
jgi:hypothetical protein